MYLLYELFHGSTLVLAAPYLVYRSLTEPGYGASLLERLGFKRPPPDSRRTIWLHAVSVGEVIASTALVPRLRQAFPDRRLVVSVTTVTGRRVAGDKLSDIDDLFYCPFDARWIVRRLVRRLAPEALVVVETEIWPNLFREARRGGAAVLLVNGRISDTSFPRYRRVRFFLERCLREVDRFLMQSPLYARRIVTMGAPEDRVEVVGSLKFDQADPEPGEKRERHLLPRGRPVLVAGSTLDPEERLLLHAFRRLRGTHSNLLLVLAPRHPRRFDEVVELVRSEGYSVARRSQGAAALEDVDVFVLDTLGELANLYGEADVVFVGGSLATWGGHNIIEPALHGKPVVFGPHMQNFPDVARLFLEAEAAVQVEDANELEWKLAELLASPDTSRELGARAQRVIASSRGAADRTVAVLVSLLS